MILRTGIGFDAHRFAGDRRLVLGGVDIESKFGLAGHSDADVLCHAVADALLGAVADGDIGRHFPDDDPSWKNVRSLDLLQTVARRLAERQATVINVDATVIAEVPRVGPYTDAMRQNMATALGVSRDCISVKGTTVEGMGALGRKEGIAVIAVAMVGQGSKGNEGLQHTGSKA